MGGKIIDIEYEINKLRKYFEYSISHSDLKTIFKKFLQGIVKFQERDLPEAIQNLGEFVEHSHRQLFSLLNSILDVPKEHGINFLKDKDIVKDLREHIFIELNIKNTDLLRKSRNIYHQCNLKKHEFQEGRIVNFDDLNVPMLIKISLKLYCLTQYISYLFDIEWSSFGQTKKRDMIKKKNLDIEKGFPELFSKEAEGVIDIVLLIISQEEISNLIIERGIIEAYQIENSSVLQNLFPFVIIAQYNIRTILNSSIEVPFRPEGPQIIDFENDNWIYIPEISIEITSILNNNKSILLMGPSGSGKTVITRFIGLSFIQNKQSVYYIDFLKLEKSERVSLIMYLYQRCLHKGNRTNLSHSLFIFENIHCLEDIEIKSLSYIKENLLSISTSRIPNITLTKVENTIELYPKSNEFEGTIKGLLEKNNIDQQSIEFLLKLKIENLWMYGIFLKLYKTRKESDVGVLSIILSNPQKLSEELTSYYKNLLNYSVLKFQSADSANYLNHLHYIISILSIFSEFETWVEYGFIKYIINIFDESPLGKLNSLLNLKENLVKKLLSYLIDIKEISMREVNENNIIRNEYIIHHSQMARIFRNTLLQGFENNFKNLRENIIYQYIFHGKYFGPYLYNRNMFGYTADYQEREDMIKKVNFDYKKFHNELINPPRKPYLENGLSYLKKQITFISLDHINKFLDSFPYDQDKKLYCKLFRIIFTDELLRGDFWRKKIKESDYRDLFRFMREVKWWQEKSVLINFTMKFQNEIISVLNLYDADKVFEFISLLIDIPIEKWQEIAIKFNLLLTNKSLVLEQYNYNLKSFLSNVFQIDNMDVLYPAIEKIVYYFLKESSIGEILHLIHQNGENNQIGLIYVQLIRDIITGKSTKDNKSFEGKIAECELYEINSINQLLNIIDQELLIIFINKFLEIIKGKLLNSKFRDKERFLVNFMHLSIPGEVKSLLFSDWDWFMNLSADIELGNLSKFKTTLSSDVFNHLDQDYKEKYETEFYILLNSKLDEHFEKLKYKVEIIRLIGYDIFKRDIKRKIANLYEDTLLTDLSREGINSFIKSLVQLAREPNLKKNSSKYVNFWRLVNSKILRNAIRQISYEDFAVLFNILKKNFKFWLIMFIEANKEKIEFKFGKNFKDKLGYNEIGRYYLNNLDSIIANLEIIEINQIYNATHESCDDLLFQKANKALNSVSDMLLISKIHHKIGEIDINEIFNFLVILYKFHSEIFETVISIIKTQTKSFFQASQSDLKKILSTIKNYELSLEIIEIFDNKLDVLTFQTCFQRSFEKLDLFTLRGVFQYILWNKLGFSFLQKMNINFDVIFSNSLFLDLLLAYFLDNLWISTGLYQSTKQQIEKSLHFVRFTKEVFVNIFSKVEFYLPKESLFWNSDNIILLPKASQEVNEILVRLSPKFIKSVKERLNTANLFDLVLFLKNQSILKLINYELVIELKASFIESLQSLKFIQKIKESDFETIYEFLEVLNFYDPEILESLYLMKLDFFHSDDFWEILYDKPFHRIIELIFFLTQEFQQDIKMISKQLGRCLLRLNLEKLFGAIRYLEINIVKLLVEEFKDELKKIIEIASKSELEKALGFSKEIFFPLIMDDEKLDVLKKNLPIIDDKLTEKYVIDPYFR